MSRLEFIVLSILYNSGATSNFKSMTVSEIQKSEDMQIQPNTYYKLLKNFVVNGAVSTGAKDGRANTYYITDVGKKMIEEAKN